jgi:hypothetical protein
MMRAGIRSRGQEQRSEEQASKYGPAGHAALYVRWLCIHELGRYKGVIYREGTCFYVSVKEYHCMFWKKSLAYPKGLITCK